MNLMFEWMVGCGGRGRCHRLVSLLSVYPTAAVSTTVSYHHQVWMNEWVMLWETQAWKAQYKRIRVSLQTLLYHSERSNISTASFKSTTGLCYWFWTSGQGQRVWQGPPSELSRAWTFGVLPVSSGTCPRSTVRLGLAAAEVSPEVSSGVVQNFQHKALKYQHLQSGSACLAWPMLN